MDNPLARHGAEDMSICQQGQYSRLILSVLSNTVVLNG